MSRIRDTDREMRIDPDTVAAGYFRGELR